MGRIIGVVNAIWSHADPRIFVHRLSPLTFLLRITSPRTRAMVLARSVWIIASLPMYIAPWSPKFSLEEPQISTAVVPVELRGRKANFEVAKLWFCVDLLADLPSRVVSGFSNGREVEISVTYLWLPVKCESCDKFGHVTLRCPSTQSESQAGTSAQSQKTARSSSKEPKARRNSRPGRSRSQRRRRSKARETSAGKEPTPEARLEAFVSDSNTHHTDELPPDPPDTVEHPQGMEIKHFKAGTNTDDLEPGEFVRPSLDDNTEEEIDDKIEEASMPVFSLDRGGYSTAVVVTHSGGNSGAPPKGHSDAEASSPFFLVNNRKSCRKVTQDGIVFANWEHHRTARIVVVWSPNVLATIYKATAQTVTCGDFNQITRASQHSDHLSSEIDVTGVEDMNLSLQEAELFEAQHKRLSFSWWNNQEASPISKKIDHAFINQAWSARFPEAYAEFLEPLQSDHSPCLFHVPSAQRRAPKPFKFFNHIIDHPSFEETVREAWHPEAIMGTDQFKLVRSLKMLKKELRMLNKTHYSGITQ
ncbi:unnamed protein product, partial [Brassica oleracea]